MCLVTSDYEKKKTTVKYCGMGQLQAGRGEKTFMRRVSGVSNVWHAIRRPHLWLVLSSRGTPRLRLSAAAVQVL